jgi:hypothetical protein
LPAHRRAATQGRSRAVAIGVALVADDYGPRVRFVVTRRPAAAP